MSNTKVTVILAEASLELVPPEIAHHPAVVRNARKRGKSPREVLLDISLHYAAMKKLRNRKKRGRPDIVHVTLLELLSSPLNIEGKLTTIVHTVNDYVIEIDPSARIPRNYNRFVGLMEQLLNVGKVPPDSEEPLLKAIPMTFDNLLKRLGVESIILLSEEGEVMKPEEVCRESVERGEPIVIGGFPHGDFDPLIKERASITASIYRKPLDTWVVASRVACGCERFLKIV